ncbi:MAG TPA: fumarylacetoacetate hydrolase family protein [Pseudonocardia sp.]|jgi:fumarylacetoacetase
MRYGSFVPSGRPSTAARLGVLHDDVVYDLSALHAERPVPWPELLTAANLDPLLAEGSRAWREVHEWLGATLADPEPLAGYGHAPAAVTSLLPFTVADYVDFYACEQHAVNAARILRPDAEPLAANWRHLPVGYHGRSATVRASGAPVRRPHGPRGPGDFGPTRALDFECELGFVVGGPATTPGEPVPMDATGEHLFGVVLLNDWSARDVQAWESRPLGPLLGKAFATSISAWVTPWDELAAARVDPPPRDPEPLPYLHGDADRGLELAVEVRINDEVVSRPPSEALYWTAPQLLAHLTCGGATVQPGDLLGSGTLSGPERAQRGCLLELSWGGREPLALACGGELTYLRDGDEVLITASAVAVGGGRVELGEVRGTVLPALEP